MGSIDDLRPKQRDSNGARANTLEIERFNMPYGKNWPDLSWFLVLRQTKQMSRRIYLKTES